VGVPPVCEAFVVTTTPVGGAADLLDGRLVVVT
jgi:hypothetical protein